MSDLKCALNPITDVLIRSERLKSQRNTQGRTSDHEGRDGVSAVLSQGTPQVASKHQMLGRSKERSPPGAFRYSTVQLIPGFSLQN